MVPKSHLEKLKKSEKKILCGISKKSLLFVINIFTTYAPDQGRYAINLALWSKIFQNMSNKPRVVKDYEKLDSDIQEQIKLMYPFGFAKHLIQYKNADGKFVSALPFETDDRYYLVRMTLIEARQIIEDDDDYDASGELKESVKEEYEEKYGDMDYLTITDGEGSADNDEEE